MLVAQTVKHLPAMRETRVRFLGWEDPLEKEMAIHSSTLAWKIPWTEEPDRLQSMGSQSQTRLSDFTFTFTMLNTVLPRCHLPSVTHLRGNNNPTMPFPPPKTEQASRRAEAWWRGSTGKAQAAKQSGFTDAQNVEDGIGRVGARSWKALTLGEAWEQITKLT